jgi:hypothetical protein
LFFEQLGRDDEVSEAFEEDVVITLRKLCCLTTRISQSFPQL